MTNSPSEAARAEILRALRPNKGLLLALGVLAILGGVAAVVWPVVASVAVTTVVGAALAVQGAAQLWDAWSAPDWKLRVWALALGLVALVGGSLLLLRPLEGVLTVTALLILLIIFSGALRLIMGFQARPHEGWGWLAFGGAVSALCGAYLLSLFGVSATATPEQIAANAATAFSILGLTAGISLIFEGWSYVFLARSIPSDENVA